MDPLAELLGECRALVALRAQVRRLCAQHAGSPKIPPVLIQGETGTGKGLLARALHRASPRAGGPFVAVNCAAIPETLLEAEMFGYEAGAFTDARQAKAGLFQAAHRGTMFLDEVGLLAEGLQSKLLTAIEEREVRRLGSTRSEVVDVWIITATSEDLDDARRAHRFHEALYHRLSVLVFRLPPLRERGDDVPRLARHFLAEVCREYALPPKTFTDAVDAALRAHAWPGNVRELANAVERAVLLSDGPQVTVESLGLDRAAPSRGAPEGPGAPRLGEAVGTLEREHIQTALARTGWNVSRAAALLGVPRNTLDYRIAKHGLRRGEGRRRGGRPTEPRGRPAAPLEGEGSPHLRWERRHVALLQAVVGTPERPPGSYAATILEELLEKVRGFGGRLEEVGPTGLIAAFGLEPSEDAPTRAAHAALAMHRAGARAGHAADPPVELRVAIHWAPIMAAQIEGDWQIASDDKRAMATVLGGLVTPAEPPHIVVSAAAARLLARRFELAAAPLAEATDAPRVRLVGLEPTGLGLGGRALSPFVGRARELEALRAGLRRAEQGAGQVIGLMGEPGVGKTRLLYEFRQSLRGHRLTYLEGHCLSYRRTTPYAPVLGVLRQACALTETDPLATVLAKVRGRLGALGLDPDEAAPYLLHALGGTEGTERLASLAPAAIRRGTFDALRRLLQQESRAQPVVLAVEDLHWIDTTSEAFLAALVESLAGVPLLVVTTYRPGYRPGWLDQSYVTQLTVPPLSSEDSQRVVESVLGAGAASRAPARAIVERAEGNPFFLEELAWATAAPAAGDEPAGMPETVQSAILARMDRLPKESKRLLQTAAVLGRAWPARRLGAVWDGAGDWPTHLQELQRLEFLYEQPAAEGPGYVLKHALTHEVAYASLPPDHRRALHARVVEVIEGEPTGRREEAVETLAHHARCAEVWDTAARYLHQAGERAVQRAANREAVVWLEQAIAACERLGDRPEFVELAVRARIVLQLALFALGEHARIRPRLLEAERLAEAIPDRRWQVRVAICLASNAYVLADHAGGLDAARRGLTLAEVLGDREGQIGLLLRLGIVHHARGEFPEAVAALHQSLALLAAGSPYDSQLLNAIPSVHARTWLAWCLADLGDVEGATARAQEARDIAEARAHAYSQVMAAWGVGYAHLARGEITLAIAALEDSLARGRDSDNLHWTARVAASLGYAYARAGRLDEGLPLLEEGMGAADRLGLRGYWPLFLTWRGEAYQLAGRTRDAADAARDALARAREQGERGSEAQALCLLAEIEPSAEHYRAAMTLAETLGMRPVLDRCQRGLRRLSDERAVVTGPTARPLARAE